MDYSEIPGTPYVKRPLIKNIKRDILKTLKMETRIIPGTKRLCRNYT